MAKWRIKKAVQTLNDGDIIAYPTEAVYGLGCDPWNDSAIQKLLRIKQRPWQKGLILIAADIEQLHEFISPITAAQLNSVEKTWPGHTTWLMPVSAHISPYLTGQHNTIAVRVTAHQQTAELCRSFGGPIVSTSANHAGKPPAKTHRAIKFHLPEVNLILKGRCPATGQTSTIRDLQSGKKIR